MASKSPLFVGNCFACRFDAVIDREFWHREGGRLIIFCTKSEKPNRCGEHDEVIASKYRACRLAEENRLVMRV